MKKIFLIPITIGLYLFVSYGQVPESDSLALVALYNSTNGDSWTDHTNWLQPGQPVSTWFGVTVTNDTVAEINLPSNNLAGNIPLEIGDFTGLKILFLYNNELSGPIPSTIGNLSELTNLFLRKNHLSDTIPEEIGMLTNLYFLRLCDNELSGPLPSELGDLINLEYLLVSNNQLTGAIPAEIFNLSNLYHLNLSNNQLSDSIPSVIGNLTKLHSLELDHNNLTDSIPGSIGNLTDLSTLNLTSNQLIGPIPAEIGDLTKMTWLSMEQNQLSGSIPSEIGNLTELYYLSLGTNELTGSIPAEIGNLTKLVNLFLYSNHLWGNIPTEIGNLRELTYLCLGNNELSGAIPHEIGNLDSLQQLSLEHNDLTDTIPSEIGNLKKLTGIFLNGNQLCGNIPDEICDLSELELIYLSYNNLRGLIPGGIKDLPSLTFLRIDNNNFNFFDLEPLTGISVGTYIYYPQDSVELSTNRINSRSGDDLEFDITDLTLSESSSINNQYQWWKDGLSITSYSDSPVLSLTSLDSSDEGQYNCTMINSDFPLLILTTSTFSLVIDGPVDIELSPDHVDENVNPGTYVGTLSADDPDQESGHSFELIEGNGTNDADNGLFSISGDTLFIDTSPDYETKQEYSIYVRVTDDDSKTFDKVLVVYVNDVQESEPTAIAFHNQTENAVRVYPNPVSDYVTLEYEILEEESVSIELYDIKGILVQTFISNEIRSTGKHCELLEIDPSIPAGCYLLTINNNSNGPSIQINKQK
jgi:Leucine-rich repeat (LRR) protein/archaellum component FlaG (FlaF/FlaG flagellin family)